MEQNNILVTYADYMNMFSNNFSIAVQSLSGDKTRDIEIIKTLNVILDSIRSQTVLTQNVIDNYGV